MRRRLLRVGAGVAVAALVAVLVVVVAGADSPPSAREALAMAKRFVKNAESVEYHGESRLEYHDPEFPEDDFTEEYTFEEAARFPDDFHSVREYGEFVAESVAIDKVTYTREAERRRDLDDELWARFDSSADDLFGGFVPFGGTAFLVPASQLPELIAEAGRPRLVSQNDARSVVRVRVDTDELEEIFYTDVRLDLVVEDGGRITTMRLVAGDEYETQHAAVEIDRWNGEVEIEEPDEDEVDPTPSVEEEDVAAFDDAVLFQPRVLPTDFALQGADVLVEGEDLDFDGEEIACDQVALYFLSQAVFETLEEGELPDSTYLSLFEFPTSCAKDRPDDAEDFVAGSYTGWFEDEYGYLYGQITVGDTVIEFDTDLEPAALMATLADLAPLDFTMLPIAPDGGGVVTVG